MVNGQFGLAVPHPDVPGNPTPTLPATFAADGTFSGQVIVGTMSGPGSGQPYGGANKDGKRPLYTFTGERI